MAVKLSKFHRKEKYDERLSKVLIAVADNVGLIFTKGDLKEVSEEVAKYKVGAPAPVGLVAPVAMEYTFPRAEKVKEFLEDPTMFAVAPAEANAAAEKVEEEKKEEEPEEEVDDEDLDWSFVEGVMDNLCDVVVIVE